MVHDLQHIDNRFDVIDATDQSITIVAHVEHDTITNLIGRTKRLPEFREI
jgi:hypothetical protein